MHFFHPQPPQMFSSILMPIATALITFLAGWVGAIYGLKQIKLQRKLDFAEKQLRELYSPLFGLHKEIEAKGFIRLKVTKAGDKIFSEAPQEILAEKMETVRKEIDYNNKQLIEDTLPKYREMLDIFRKNIGLAEPETLAYYPMLVELVEIWNRWLEKSIDPDVVKQMNHSDGMLKPFFDELELRTSLLKKRLTE